MKLTKELLNNLIEITSNSAIACFPYVGKNEKILADKAATDVMREQLNKLNIKGKVVIGEGELDEDDDPPMVSQPEIIIIADKINSSFGCFIVIILIYSSFMFSLYNFKVDKSIIKLNRIL